MNTTSPQFTQTKEYQIKLLSLMVSDPEFCTVASEALQQEDFADRALQWYYNVLSVAKPHLTATTLKEELFKKAKAGGIPEDHLNKYVEYYEFLCQPPIPMEREHIIDNLSTFMRTQAMKRAVQDSWEYIAQGNWDEVVSAVDEASKVGMHLTDMGTFFFEDFEDRIHRRANSPQLEKLSTGIAELDNLLYGGIKPQQLGLIAGGTGRGKSIFLQWLSRVAILLGKKVVYFTLELSEEDIAERFDALFSHIKIGELQTYNNELYNHLAGMSSKFGKNLCIKSYPADVATVTTLKSFLQQLSGIGFVPDLVVVDYLDLLKPHRNYNSQYEELDAITKALHGFSKEVGTRVWTATQLNRSGLVAETPDESTIAGAVAKLFTPDVAIFMAQTKEEREDQIMRLLVAKNRNGPAGRTIQLDTDYSYMTFYRSPIHNPTPTASAAPLAAATLTSAPAPVSPSEPSDASETLEDTLAGVEEAGGVLILS